MSPWRLLGLGAVVGVAAVGVVVARPVRAVVEVDDEELSARLHAVLDEHRARTPSVPPGDAHPVDDALPGGGVPLRRRPSAWLRRRFGHERAAPTPGAP